MSGARYLVIVDPAATGHPAFDRALLAARDSRGHIHLFGFSSHPPIAANGESSSDAQERFRSEALATLGELAAHAEAQGIGVSMELGTSGDARQEMVQAAARSRADMVFKYSSERTLAHRDPGDWLLMRLAPCPVLMVKNVRDWSSRRVLGAVNFGSHDLAHIKLNNQIIGEAQRFAHDFGSEAHFVTAYADRNRAPDRVELARVCGVAPERMHTVQGAAASVIRDTAERIGADLILIGTVARSGLMGTVVGNTAERILDETRSDVLVLN